MGAAATVACSPDLDATVVALPAEQCGLEKLELTLVRIVPRGDFPPSEAPPVQARDGTSVFEDFPEGVRALTVEGQEEAFTGAVGRTARIDESGELPVYFAPPDELCFITSGAGVTRREETAVAVGPRGDVVLAGGRLADGELTDELLHVRDVEGFGTRLSARLPEPTIGHTIHPIGPRRFAVIGGATADLMARNAVVVVDLEDGPEGAAIAGSIPIELPGGGETRRAHHASAVLPSGRILVTGGCSTVVDGACDPVDGSVTDGAFVVVADPQANTVWFDRAPPLRQPRYGHTLLVARDGVAFVAGGWGSDGAPLTTIERLRPAHDKWERYGPPLDTALPGGVASDTAVVGATLLEGGIVVLALSTDEIVWISEHGSDALYTPCETDGNEDTDERCPWRFGATIPISRRPLLTLPGERIVADAYVLPVALLDRLGSDRVDLSLSRPGGSSSQRTGASMAPLADGTVLFAGGRDPATGDMSQLFLLRLRPPLDGPDEEVPDVAELDPGSFVLHDIPYGLDPKQHRIELQDGALEFRPAVLPETFPSLWAHVRGFRSASFRIELTIDPITSDAVPHLVFTQGAASATSIRFDGPVEGPTGFVRGATRDAAGRVTKFNCALTSPVFGMPTPLRIDVSPDGIEILSLGEVIAQCPVKIGNAPSAVGVGASGTGTIRFSSFRLTRI